VALKPPFAALAEAARPQDLWAALVVVGTPRQDTLPAALERYDFVAFSDYRPIHLSSSRCLAPFFVQPTFQIFVVVHDLDCAGPAG